MNISQFLFQRNKSLTSGRYNTIPESERVRKEPGILAGIGAGETEEPELPVDIGSGGEGRAKATSGDRGGGEVRVRATSGDRGGGR